MGMIPLVAPNFKQWIWHELHPLIESGILLASIAAVVLNAFFNGARGTAAELQRAAAVADH
jgi:NCS2 family nucleobase:cation symporter-2